MGFGPKNNGNKVPASIPTVIGTTPAVTPINDIEIKPPEEKLTEEKYVADTFHNKVGVNVDRFPSVIADIKGWAEGSAITVTYYKEHYSETDIKGRTDTDESMHPAHKSVLKINNFEMRLTGALQYTHDTDESISKLSGEAVTYPGFEPEIGDLFTYEVELGRYGVFKIVNPPVRMSIRASTYFKITFDLVEYMTEELANTIEKGVTDVAYFDKQRFLNEPGALLYHDEVVELKFLESSRAKMIHYYRSKFLDEKIMYSFMRPDSVYDPYVTDFLMKTLEFSELGTMGVQLYQDAPFMDVSIWRAFLDPNVPLEAVPSSTKKYTYSLGSKSVLANSLINRKYVEWIKSESLKDYIDSIINDSSSEESTEGEITPDSSIPEVTGTEEEDKILGDLMLHLHPHYRECPLADNGEEGESAGGLGDAIGYILGDGDYRNLVIQFLLYRKIVTLDKLHTLIENVWKLEPIEQFYRMAVLIFMCNVVCRYIHHMDGIFEP